MVRQELRESFSFKEAQSRPSCQEIIAAANSQQISYLMMQRLTFPFPFFKYELVSCHVISIDFQDSIIIHLFLWLLIWKNTTFPLSSRPVSLCLLSCGKWFTGRWMLENHRKDQDVICLRKDEFGKAATIIYFSFSIIYFSILDSTIIYLSKVFAA